MCTNTCTYILFVCFKGNKNILHQYWFPGGLDGKEFACNVGDPDLISGLGRSPGKWNSNRRQCSCLENSMERGVWQATVHGVMNSRTQLNDYSLTFHAIYSLPCPVSKYLL